MRSHRSLLIAVAAATPLLAPSLAPAEDAESPHNVTGTLAITNDYVFRGISQTSEDPAIQGSFDYAYEPFGFYAGVWASNLDFNTAVGQTDDAAIEIDYYGGFKGTFANDIGWDVGFVYYSYPSQDEDDILGVDYDYVEAKGALSYTFSDMALSPTVGASFYYSPEYFGDTGDAIYVGGTLNLALPQEFALGFAVGYQDIDVGDIDYVHWSVGLSRTVMGIGLSLAYQDAEEDACGGGDICDGRVVFTASVGFELF